MSAAVILCIDDNVLALTARQCILERAGYRVVTAGTAAKARQIFASRHVDLVITDHYLPDGATGTELAADFKMIRQDTPVLWFSGVAEEPDHPEHVDSVVHKDEKLSVLFGEIERLLGQPIAI